MTFFSDDSVLQRTLDQHLVSNAQLESARNIVNRHAPASVSATRLLAHFVDAGTLSEWQLARLRAQEFGFHEVALDGLGVADDVVRCVPRLIAERYTLLPISRSDGVLRIAVSDPLSAEGPDRVSEITGLCVEIVVAPKVEITRAIEQNYGREAATTLDYLDEIEMNPFESPQDDHSATADDAPLIKLVHEIIQDGIKKRASDIHWEPMEKRFRVRFRIDGALVEGANPRRNFQPAIISRIKIMANISIAQKRLPQDGRIQLQQDGRSVDLRVSTVPTSYGESVVMRVLDRNSLQPGLDDLGLEKDHRAELERLIALPDGIVLVTGPTGSGKTSTLYSCLQQLNQSNRKIITVEDPVEFELNGINQVPVRAGIGLTFATALRAMLRQAPNVVMVGEIRDRETAEIAVNASLTGHMVFSTLHTNDACGAITRLVDIGVKPFLLAASVRGIVAQRLIRRICVHCHVATPAERTALGPRFTRGFGCLACNGTGYLGRVGIFEIVVINEELQQLIHDRASLSVLRVKARALGMRTLREDGLRKVSAGLTTAEEVVSITVGEPSPSHPLHPP